MNETSFENIMWFLVQDYFFLSHCSRGAQTLCVFYRKFTILFLGTRNPKINSYLLNFRHHKVGYNSLIRLSHLPQFGNYLTALLCSVSLPYANITEQIMAVNTYLMSWLINKLQQGSDILKAIRQLAHKQGMDRRLGLQAELCSTFLSMWWMTLFAGQNNNNKGRKNGK